MTADRLTRTVRQQLGLGRLLPLGEPEDGAWIAERAAVAVLRSAAAPVHGVRLESLRLDLAEPETTATGPVPPVVQPPPSGLPPGPVRLEADISASADEPLPDSAERLRATLARAAEDRLGLTPAGVDVRVTGLYDESGNGDAPDAPGDPGPDGPGEPGGQGEPGGPGTAAAEPPGTPGGTAAGTPPDASEQPAARAARAAAAVTGVARLAPVLSAAPDGSGVRGVQVTDRAGINGGRAVGRHLQVQIAVAGSHRALDVARSVRAAVTNAVTPSADAAEDVPGPVTVAVLITAVES